MKKKVAITIPLVLIVGYLAVLSFLTLRTKGQYESVAEELTPPKIIELTSKLEAQILDGISRMDSQDHSDQKEQDEKRMVYAEIGLPPSTEGFVRMITFEPPPFDLFDMDENRRNAQTMILQGILLPVLHEESLIYVKRDNQEITKAFIRIRNGESYWEIENDENGVYRDIMHYTPTEAHEVEPDERGQ